MTSDYHSFRKVSEILTTSPEDCSEPHLVPATSREQNLKGPASVVNGVLRGSAFFNTFVPNYTNTVIRWKFGDGLVAQIRPGKPAEYFHQFTERCRVYENGSLELNNILKEDEGEYTLTAKRTERYQLRVYASLTAPVLRPDPQEIISGTNVTLHCDAGNQTVTNYTFYHDKMIICSESHVTCSGSSLDFTPISKGDNGSYTCRIQNPVSSNTSDPITVTLLGYPEGGILCTTKSIRQAIQLGCSWSGGNPTANVTMIYDNRTESGQEQVSKNVSASDNIQGSSLTCNGHQLGRNSTCALLLEPPQSPDHEVNSKIQVTEGKSVNLTLTLSSGVRSRGSSSLRILPADFSWFHDSRTVKNDEKFQMSSSDESSRLQISKVSEVDSGIYKCRAKNVIGTEDFFFTLRVTSRGLDMDAIVGIVLGIVAGLFIAGVGVIVYFIFKGKETKPKALIHEHTDSPIYENTAPGAREEAKEIETTSPSRQEGVYEQIQYEDQSLYCNVMPGRRT